MMTSDVTPIDSGTLPDSSEPSGTCPRCHFASSFDVLAQPIGVTYRNSLAMRRAGKGYEDPGERVSVLLCRHCRQAVVVVEEQLVGGVRVAEGRSGGLVSWRGIHWWPLPTSVSSAHIPGAVADVVAEAERCLAARCPRAAVAMARRALEGIAEEKGIGSGPLADRLKRMAAEGTLYPALAEWAAEIRLIGNMGAHYDLANAVTEDDAQELLRFLTELLKYLYVMPKQLEKLRSSRKVAG